MANLVCSKHGRSAALFYTVPRGQSREYQLMVFNLDTLSGSDTVLRKFIMLNTAVRNMDPSVFKIQEPLECTTLLNSESV